MATDSFDSSKLQAAVASSVASCVSEVSRDVYTHLITEAPQLRADEIVLSILRTSVEENIATLPHVLEFEIPLGYSPGPAAVLEYPRRLAKHFHQRADQGQPHRALPLPVVMPRRDPPPMRRRGRIRSDHATNARNQLRLHRPRHGADRRNLPARTDRWLLATDGREVSAASA